MKNEYNFFFIVPFWLNIKSRHSLFFAFFVF